MTDTTHKILLTPQETCTQLGIGRSHLWKRLASGEIPSVKLGKLRRIPYQALVAWVERKAPRQDQSAPEEGRCTDHAVHQDRIGREERTV